MSKFREMDCSMRKQKGNDFILTNDITLQENSNNSYIQNSNGHLIIDNNVTDKHIRLKLGEDNSDTAVQIRNNSNSTVTVLMVLTL